MESSDTNYKNRLLSWSQKNNHDISFDTIQEASEGSRKIFTIGIVLNGELVAQGNGYNKKEAGQVAAKEAIDKLGIE